MKKAAGAIVSVFVVVPPRVLLLDIAGPVEVLRKANLAQSEVVFEVSYVGAGPTVTSSVGLEISRIKRLPENLPERAMVLVPGSVDDRLGEGGSPILDERSAEQGTVAWLADTVRPSHTLVCICSGALLAARAGLLDGTSCTTHHASCAELARLAPRARVLENRLFVEDGRRYTSAGVTAGVDLMLYLVGKVIGPACVLSIARYLVIYLRRSGADPQLSPWLDGRNHIHPAVHRVQDAIAIDPTRKWTLRDLGQVAHTSPRHLSRLFNEHTGVGIRDYSNRLRVALARELLLQTRLGMDEVAGRVGFASARQLRRAWRRCDCNPPSEVRKHGESSQWFGNSARKENVPTGKPAILPDIVGQRPRIA